CHSRHFRSHSPWNWVEESASSAPASHRSATCRRNVPCCPWRTAIRLSLVCPRCGIMEAVPAGETDRVKSMSSINPPGIAQPNGDRDSQGRFTKGNKGGPGNPYARQVAALRQRLLDRLTAQEMDGIVDTLLRLARQGDVAAAKLIFQYALG